MLVLRNSLKKLNRRWSKIPISYRGGIILTILAMCTIAILIAWSELRQDAIAVHREIDRSEATLVETNNLLQLLTSAETGVRGYVITNQSNFLESYNLAVANLPSHLEKLENLHGNTLQHQNVQRIATLVEQELALLAQIRDSTPSEIISLEGNNLLTQSQQKVSEVEAIANAFMSQERKNLSQQRQELFNVREQTN